MNKQPHNTITKHGSLRVLLCLIVIMAGVMVTGSRGLVIAQIPANDDNKVIPVIPTADRYQEGKLFLERADKLLKPSAEVDYQVLVGSVMFRRGDMYMYCDSAHFYDATSSLEAFGNVKMEQGDTLFVYADELEYADSTQKAILYADPGKKVRLINRDVELLTDIFNYDMGIELGYYDVGGELIDKQNRLTSIYGEYAPKTKDAIFRNRVHLNSLSRGDTLNIWTEALYYNTDTHIAELDAPSTITSNDGTILTDNGVYNTETDIADLYERSLVVTSTGKTLTGDTLFYDHKAGYGEAWGNIILNDTVNKSKLYGDYGYYNEILDSAFVTGQALVVDYSQADSLSLHGDTIKAFRVITASPLTPKANQAETIDAPLAEEKITVADTTVFELPDSIMTINDDVLTPDSVPTDSAIVIPAIIESSTLDSITTLAPDSLTAISIDSINAATPDSLENLLMPAIPAVETADTTHHIVAYPNVRFYRSDLQGVCDSLTFVQKDSLLYMDRDPIVWSDNRQIFGEVIIVHMNDSTADRVNLPRNAFMAEMLEEGFYNQLAGREMTAFIANKTLKHVDVSGNVSLIFFPMEEDSTYNKVANAESSFLAADFERGQIKRMKMWSQSSETITPLYLAKRSLFYLPKFRWESSRRPVGHHDLMPPAATGPATTEDGETPTSPEGEENTESVHAVQGEIVNEQDTPDDDNAGEKEDEGPHPDNENPDNENNSQ